MKTPARSPKAVRRKAVLGVLLDEIEKAHPDVFNILLAGARRRGTSRITTGRVIDFKNTVVIMTVETVGARDVVKGKTLGFGKQDAKNDFERMSEKVKEEVNKVFNPEFLNRLDDVIVFHSLNRDHIALIVAILARDVQKRLGEEELSLRAHARARPTSWSNTATTSTSARDPQARHSEIRRGPALGEDPRRRFRQG